MNTPSMQNTFGRTLRRLAREKDLIQQDISDQSGLGRTHISRYYSGSRLPERGSLKMLARAMNLDPQETLELLVAWWANEDDPHKRKEAR